MQHVVLYSEICKKILQYWDIPKEIVPLAETLEVGKMSGDREKDSEWSVKDVVESENLASCLTGNSAATCGSFMPGKLL